MANSLRSPKHITPLNKHINNHRLLVFCAKKLLILVNIALLLSWHHCHSYPLRHLCKYIKGVTSLRLGFVYITRSLWILSIIFFNSLKSWISKVLLHLFYLVWSLNTKITVYLLKWFSIQRIDITYPSKVYLHIELLHKLSNKSYQFLNDIAPLKSYLTSPHLSI